MDHQTEIEKISELLGLTGERRPFVANDEWTTINCERYLSPERFSEERRQIHHQLPQIAAHGSALAEPGSFKTMNFCGIPLLLVRDNEGRARAFYNVCRHRGAELVAEDAGCQQRFSCPYHAWTWNNAGELIGVPHEKAGFPGIERESMGLRSIACAEYGGWIWVQLNSEQSASNLDIPAHLGELAHDIAALQAEKYVIFEGATLDIAANWKLLVEGGLEAYHFRVAHRDTIAPLFIDNLSSYECFGPHIRSILPRASITTLADKPRDSWSLVEHANLLYSLFPGSQFLVQEDHFVWIQGVPIAPDHTRLILTTMIPASANSTAQNSYWQRNHALTVKTLIEDFDLAEGIQRGLQSGANQQLNFGRFEGALAVFNRCVDQALAPGATCK